jgi:hypothetical protein
MAKHGTTIRTTKKYPRVTAGPLRHQYVHRVVAAALIGRDLERDEEVHHRNGNKLDFHWRNLIVLGSKDHGWVSAKQAWYMRQLDIHAKQEWDEFMDAEGERFHAQVAAAKAAGEPWQEPDGKMAERWAELRLDLC